jgi:hypothetical protein
MDESRFRQFRAYMLATTPGIIPLRPLAALDQYDDAVDRYEHDGNRGALLRALLSIGVSPEDARWHAANPGQRMMCAAGE